MSHAYGRNHEVDDPQRTLSLVHRHTGGVLKAVTHDIPLAVLEQENFARQGIDTTTLVPSAPKVDALGNCVLNAGTAAVSFLGINPYKAYLAVLGLPNPTTGFADTKLGEEAAIIAYHQCTDMTGKLSTEWPPTDCGSSGGALVAFLQKLGIVKSQQVASTMQDVVSLLQTSPVLEGTPFFNSWEEPNAGGFVDGNGSASAFQEAERSGVAGGHETLIFGVEKISLDAKGQIEPAHTVLLVRNSWGKAWGDAGCFRIHASTLRFLSGYCDYRSLVA